MHRRRARRAAHGPRPRRHPGRWRRRAHQRVHPHPARAVRPGPLARRAGHAGRDHAPAALVLLPPVQGVLLVAHRHGAAAGADGPAPTRPQPARRRHRGAVRAPRRTRCGTGSAAPTARAWGRVFKASTASSAPPSRLPCRSRTRAIAGGRRLRDRAPERRGRAGRHLPRHGQHRHDVRRPGLRAGPPPRRHRLGRRAEAAGRHRRRGLLPALPVADLGHQPRRPRRGRGRGRRHRQPGRRLRLAGGPPDHRACAATGRDRAPDAPPGGWAFQYENAALPRRGRHRRRRHAAAPRWRPAPTPRPSPAPATGSWACRAAMAAGARSTPTTPTTSSTTSRSPTTAPCSTRPPPTSPPAASRSWRRLGHGGDGARHRPRASTICAASRSGRKLVRPLGHQLHLRHLVRALRPERRRAAARRPSHRAAPPPGCSPASARMAAGARTRRATPAPRPATTTAAPRPRPPGRCSA